MRDQGGAVLFFSPGAARGFVALVRRAGLGAGLAGLEAVCISRAVARAARAVPGLDWGRVAVAAHPDTPALLAALASVARGFGRRGEDQAPNAAARGSIRRR